MMMESLPQDTLSESLRGWLGDYLRGDFLGRLEEARATYLQPIPPEAAGRVLLEAWLRAGAEAFAAARCAGSRPPEERRAFQYEGTTGAEDTRMEEESERLFQSLLAALNAWLTPGEPPPP